MFWLRPEAALCFLVAALAATPLAVAAASPQTTREALPDADELLRLALLPPQVPYSGEVSVVTGNGKTARAKELLVRFAPPDRFRREVVDPYGFTSQIIVSDGKTQWFYDRARRTVWKTVPSDPDYKRLGPEEEFDLLTENYILRLTGEDRIAGRPCWVVELRSQQDARTVKSVWIDKRYGLILQAKSFQADGSLSSTMRFVQVQFAPRLEPGLFRFSPPLGSKEVESLLKPDYLELEDARLASGLSPRQPGWLPPGYVFESLNVVPYGGSTLLHYRYSDGIDALSLFQCPRAARLDLGELPEEPLRLRGARARLSLGPDGKILEWPSHGQRFVLVGNLPLDSLRQVADSVQ